MTSNRIETEEPATVSKKNQSHPNTPCNGVTLHRVSSGSIWNGSSLIAIEADGHTRFWRNEGDLERKKDESGEKQGDDLPQIERVQRSQANEHGDVPPLINAMDFRYRLRNCLNRHSIV